MPKLQYELMEQGGSFEATKGETLFDELALQNIIWPHGCLAGSCGACRTEIIEGSENLSAPSAVEKDTLEKIREEQNEEQRLHPMRLACRAKIAGDIKIKPFK